MRAHNRMDLKSSVLMQRLGAKGYKPYRERLEVIPTVKEGDPSSSIDGRSSTVTNFSKVKKFPPIEALVNEARSIDDQTDRIFLTGSKMLALAKTREAKDVELIINDESTLNRSLVKTASQTTKKPMRTNDKPTQSTDRLMGLSVKPQ